MSDLGAVLRQLKQERVRLAGELRQLDQAIRALSTISIRGNAKQGQAKRLLSVSARKRIAAAQKARWAKFRAAKSRAA